MSQPSPLSKSPTKSLAIQHYFRRLQDPRRRQRRLHRLLDIIVIAICAVLCGADNWQEVATFGQHRQAWLKRFLALPHGIPSHDTFERVFDRLDPQAFQACFRSWIAALCVHLEMPHIAIDGKTLRHSGTTTLGPLHVVSAWATAQHLVLGQEAVTEKSNEITAIPRLLEVLDLAGALVTIDAMGCQKTIAAQIIAQDGDYVLAVKDNQPTLYADVQQVFDEVLSAEDTPLHYRASTTTERNHGRIETRHYHVVSLPTNFAARHPEWEGLQSLGMVLSERQVGDQEPSYEARFFISSLPPRVRRFAQAVRQHWGIENSLHWHMDITFGEDASRLSKRHAAENFALLRRLALGLLKRHPEKKSIACKRFAAALDTAFLEEILHAAGNSEKA
jgi:predicted transposase YbfD/YdcC